MTDSYSSTAADHAAYADIVAAAYEFPAGSPEWTRLQFQAADQIVSCYTGCDGEREHEKRRDGSCRCGKYTARRSESERVLEIIDAAAKAGIDLDPEDFGPGVTLDGMPAREWLEAMTDES